MSAVMDFDLPPDEQTEPPAAEDVKAIFDPPEPEPDTATVDAGEVKVTEAPEEEEEAPEESRSQKRIRQEIEKRKELETRLDQIQQQNQVMEQRFQALMQRAQEAQQPAPEEVPSFDEDPAQHLLKQQERLQQQVEQQQAMTLQQQQAMAQQQQLAQVQNQYEQLEQAFAQQHTDYYERIEGLKKQRIQMWMQLGKTEAQALQNVQAEAWNLVMDGLQSGRNPAEVFYSMSAPQAPQAVEQVQREAQRPRASSLGSRSGGTSKAPSLQDLANMSEEEFAKATAGNNWQKLWQ